MIENYLEHHIQLPAIDFSVVEYQGSIKINETTTLEVMVLLAYVVQWDGNN